MLYSVGEGLSKGDSRMDERRRPFPGYRPRVAEADIQEALTRQSQPAQEPAAKVRQITPQRRLTPPTGAGRFPPLTGQVVKAGWLPAV